MFNTPAPTPFTDFQGWLYSLNTIEQLCGTLIPLGAVALVWIFCYLIRQDANCEKTKLEWEIDKIKYETQIAEKRVQYLRYQENIVRIEKNLKLASTCSSCGKCHG